MLETKKNPLFNSGFSRLVHSGGFEPPTARFVAEYSIQLSYECIMGAYYRVLIYPVNRLFRLNSTN